jgi:hypothetical protein
LSKLHFGLVDGPETPRFLASGVCYCCKTSLVTGSDGALYAAWRHVYPGNIRDIAFTVSRDGGRTFAAPVRVSEDRWVIDGCPENGPSLAAAQDGRVHVVWPTLVPGLANGGGSEPALGLFYSVSADGRRFAERQRLPTEGTPYHPQVAVNRRTGLLFVVWDELRGGRRHAVAARAASSDGRFAREALASPASYPVVAPAGDGFVAAWTDTSGPLSSIRIRRLR